MSGRAKQVAATEGALAEDRARHMLAQLHQADAAVRRFPEPRSGPAFENAHRHWSAIYARAIELGASFKAEGS
jgi:hypothetical protein